MIKRFCTILCLMFILSSCSISGERIKEPVKFYYPKNEITFQSGESMIAWEEREASGHRDNLSYLLALYRLGPSSESLSLPFPEGTTIMMTGDSKKEITLVLGNHADTMSDADFSLACACLTLTCAELTGIPQVTVIRGDQTVTMTSDSLLLTDNTINNTMEAKK